MGAPRTLSTQDLEDVLNGACLLGCGGGGPLGIGQQLLQEIASLGKPVLVADPADVPDDAWLAVAAIEGSPVAAEAGVFPWEIAGAAFTKLGEELHRTHGYLLPIELGAGNSLIALIAAANLGIPVVDASGAPRAVPTLDMVTFPAEAVSPIVMTDRTRSVVVEVPDARAAETATREIVGGGTFPGFAGIGLWSMDGATMKQSSALGTLGLAQAVGRVLREAKAAGIDPVAAVAGSLNGYTLFVGENLTSAERTVAGFDLLTVRLTSLDGESTLTIDAQNENLIAWSSAEARPLAMMPDLICYLTSDGQPFSNADLELASGKQVAVIGAPVSPSFRTAPVMAAVSSVLQGIGYAGRIAPVAELRGSPTPAERSPC